MSKEKTGFWNRVKQNVKNLTSILGGDKSKRPLGLPAPSVQKYELTNETFDIQTGTKPITLHRIRAVKDFTWQHPFEKPFVIRKGDLGGFVEKRENLSEDHNAWVAENAMVYGDAVVKDNALVRGQASISGYAMIAGNALVKDLVVIKDFAKVSGSAVVFEAITVEDNSIIRNNVYVRGSERVRINKESRHQLIE